MTQQYAMIEIRIRRAWILRIAGCIGMLTMPLFPTFTLAIVNIAAALTDTEWRQSDGAWQSLGPVTFDHDDNDDSGVFVMSYPAFRVTP